jgi:hypothetical protein
MTDSARSAAMWPYRIWAACLRACGWVGIAGAILLAAGVADIVRTTRFIAPPAALPVAAALPRRSPVPTNVAPPMTIDKSAFPEIQRELAAHAASNGLGWPAARYRVLPATDSLPPVYEVHCTLKGPYTAIRRFVVATLSGPPPAALREFALGRAGSDSAEAEAHLTFAFFVRPDARPIASAAADAASGVRP